MVQITNISTIKELRKATQISNSEVAPLRLAESIVPVIDINPQHARVCDIVKTNASSTTGAITIYTTPSDKDFYLTGYNIVVSSNVTADNTSLQLSITVDKLTVTLADIRKQSVTAGNLSAAQDFSVPIKIDRATAITLETTFTVGGAVKAGTIMGYTVDAIEN